MGEIPLSPYDSCRLASINLAQMTQWGEEIGVSCVLKRISQIAYRAQIYMDILVDAEKSRILTILTRLRAESLSSAHKTELATEIALWEKILYSLERGRRTGLGVTGEADLLAKMGYRYGSAEGNKFSSDVHREIAVASYKASIDLAKAHGAFPAWNRDVEFTKIGYKKYTPNNPFLRKIWDELDDKYRAKWVKYGRRNIANLTIAPNGSLSILLGCTSGMEPVFEAFHTRRRKVVDGEEYHFVDATGDKWQMYNIIHQGLVDWYAWKNGLDLADARAKMEAMPENDLDNILKESPYYGVSAHDIYPPDKVKLQGMIQQWVDHSISVTHNLPKTATVEDVYNIYKLAYTVGCKGCTVYRDGSRDGVLLKKDTPKTETLKIHDAPKRPKTLECDIHQVVLKGRTYTIIVGKLNGYPYEVFGTSAFTVDFKEGLIEKVKRSVYNLHSKTTDTVVVDITSGMTAQEELVTRMASMGLRHGADIRFIAEQLAKTKEDLSSFSKVLARVLRKYVKDGIEVTGAACPECGSQLVYEGGCSHCTSCPYETC